MPVTTAEASQPVVDSRNFITLTWTRFLNTLLQILSPATKGNGASGTAVTTTLQGTGGGPVSPQVIAGYVRVQISGSTYWVPVMQ